MSNLLKMLANLSRQEEDEILGKAIQSKFDAELRADWESKLQDQYGLSKNSKIIKIGRRRNRLVYIAGIAAGFLLIILSLLLVQPSSTNIQSLAYSYLEEVEAYHPGAMKGPSDNQENRDQAIQAFNRRNYAGAVRYFSLIEDETDEDLYYSALASLLNENPWEAISKFEMFRGKGTAYQEEINWYLSIAFMLNGQKKEAKALLSEILRSDWNYDKAQKLLNAME